MLTNFIYFSTGSDVLHHRTIFSVLSLLAYYTPKEGEKILIFTDVPKFYTDYLRDESIEYIKTSQEDVKKMMGSDNLIHRVKIGIIKQSTEKYPNHKFLYVDSDTFFYKDFANILDKITSESSLMHLFEYNMGLLKKYPIDDNDGFGLMYDFISNKSLKFNDKDIKIDITKFNSWNAGMIGLHPSHFDIFDEVYQITDQFYTHSRCHACEQYAFSYVIEKRTKMDSCEDFNYHYWHKIKKKITDKRLSKYILKKIKNETLEHQKATVKLESKRFIKTYPKHPYTLSYEAFIAMSEKKYRKGFGYAFRSFLKKPNQPWKFFKDLGYYTKKMLFG